ncbi:MAG: metallophosphoesterase family protein [Clostridia bacterium]|nr:metallophosphoesterase family protein [Clostridia bacterium]
MNEKPSFAKRLLHSTLALDFKHQRIDVEAVPLTCPGLPQAFHLARIAVVADVHLPDQVVSIPRLLRLLQMQRLDAIFLPGDLTNSYTDFDQKGLYALARELTKIAPCFAVPGNHEQRLGREPTYRRILEACGVHYMSDSYADWHKDGATLRLFGMGEKKPMPLDVTGQPAIVLAHRPEYLADYAHAGWDIVICGHAHGGHVRVGGASLFSPDQGFFPAYTHGVYEKGGTRMIVSRGLGNSSIPWRVNNPPHLPILILSAKQA